MGLVATYSNGKWTCVPVPPLFNPRQHLTLALKKALRNCHRRPTPQKLRAFLKKNRPAWQATIPFMNPLESGLSYWISTGLKEHVAAHKRLMKARR